MPVTETWVFELPVKADPNQTKEAKGQKTLLSANHKTVLATATLSGLSEHNNNNPATAGVQFTEITKGVPASSSPISQSGIAENGTNLSELKWTLKATNCWAHAVIFIQCLD